MSKYQQIFKAMSEGAELEVSTALGVWAKADRYRVRTDRRPLRF